MGRDAAGLALGYVQGLRVDLRLIERTFGYPRAGVAMAMMYLLEREARRSDDGRFSISDADLARRTGSTRQVVIDVRRILCRLGVLEVAETGQRGKVQMLRVTCFDDVERIHKEATVDPQSHHNGPTNDGPWNQHSGDPAVARPTMDPRRHHDGPTKAPPSTKGKGNRDLFGEDCPDPACSACRSDPCFCPSWDAYRNSLKRWESAAGSKAEALRLVGNLSRTDRAALVEHLAKLCAHLDGHDPARVKFFGLTHLKTYINQRHRWGELPEATAQRQAGAGGWDEWKW